MHMATQLDIDVMRKLYEFGGLLSYHVTYFDPVIFQTIETQPTFDEKVAKVTLQQCKEYGRPAKLVEKLIKFDGAFAVK